GQAPAGWIERQVAGVGRHRDDVGTGRFVALPEPDAAAAAAARRDDVPRRVEDHAPHRALESFLRLELFRRARLPVEEDHERIADAGERIRHVRDAGTGQPRTVSVERYPPCPTD